ncbi:MAG: hypothetical protein KF831_01970 [Acidobacteria bacterium]|nr:hypothetical protein [Acidobacteriota bacterium]
MKTLPFFILMLSIVFTTNVIAQDESKPPTAIFGRSGLVELSNMAGDLSDCAKAPRPYTGTIVQRKFDDDEITLIGIIIRDSKDERTFLNLDSDQISRLDRAARSNLSSFLGKGKRIRAWAYMCGVSGGVQFASRVKAL